MKKTQRHTIQLLGETIVTGAGTVPTSSASVSQTSIKEMVSLLRKASRKGIFESKETHEYGSFQDSPK